MTLEPEDEALIDRLVEGTLRYRMGVPAIFLLEAFSPLAVVGSFAMQFLAPVVSAFVSPTDYERLGVLLGRREVLELVIRRLERALDDPPPTAPGADPGGSAEPAGEGQQGGQR